MTRTDLQKAEMLSSDVLRAGSRLRLRAQGLLSGAMAASGISKTELAKRLGVRKSAVGEALKGNGNFHLQTLAEYLGVMGFELELVPMKAGEALLSMRERRAPEVVPLTLRDHDWDSTSLVVQARRGTRENRVGAATVRALNTRVSSWGSEASDPVPEDATTKAKVG